ncbi:sensor histidine kinase [Chitinophaga nivalis]|uniref:Signal transduction histidine kinase dimerisation/phosphoacceptor domain-containing protein n=1 Tax=Chitinophaga nivalis TaxID=2991709 RepID=A0ABT3IMX2_9BACT|nr:hypothetical protein [Chitinophaga nivalis]MCW3465052.1 hypothetical protein [Chitinophaga nivalis]MCW3485256.1 hypothetical protein [Chitinophaga nivalis]
MRWRHLTYLFAAVLLFLAGNRTPAHAVVPDEVKRLHVKLRLAKDSSSYTKFLNDLAFHYHRNNLDSCYWYASKALEIAERRQNIRAKSYAYTNLALFYTFKRNPKMAVIYNYEALKLDQVLCDSGAISTDYSNLALAYRGDGNIGKAQYYEQLSIQLGCRFLEHSDYNIDLINYLIYYWKDSTRQDSVQWALAQLRVSTEQDPYSMEWYNARLFEAMDLLKTHSFQEVEKKINNIAADALQRGLPETATTAYYHMLDDLLPMGYPVDSIAYAQKIFPLARQTGDDESLLDVSSILFRHYSARHDPAKAALYGQVLRRLATAELLQIRKLPAVDHISYFLRQQQLQELSASNQLQQHRITENELRKSGHQLLLKFLLGVLILLAIFTGTYWWSYYCSRRHIRALTSANTDITEKNIRLQENDTFKNKLLSLIAHDFRAPLKDILHTARWWQHSPPDRQSMLNSLSRIELNSRKTLDTFDGILRWIKLQLTGFSYLPASCDIHVLFATALEHMQENIRSKQLTTHLEVPLDTLLAADNEVLQFVHRTLLGQIIALTGHLGTLTITARSQNRQTIVTIKGYPIMITPALLQLLDHPQQHDGLILATCSDFLDKMGGSLQLMTEAPMTYGFVYTLPSHRP